MKKIKKFSIILIITLLASLIPNFCKAITTTEVYDETTLRDAIENANAGDTIQLTADISLTRPLEITDKNITINGAQYTITRNTENWTPNGANGSLITAGGNGTTLNLQNLFLTNSQKYGVQSYNGAYVILDNVTVSNCAYGGVLANAGTVEVKNLTLKKNGGEGYNNGIEIAKSSSLSSDNKPILKMNGTLSSTEQDNVIYVDINDPVAGFEVINSDDTVNKVFINNNKVVVTDQNNNILYESNEITGIDEIEGEPYVKNVTVSIKLMDQTVTITLQEGTTLTRQEVESQINLPALNLNNYVLDDFYTDQNYSQKFEFGTAITNDITIYAKLTLKETPPIQNPSVENPGTQEPTTQEPTTNEPAVQTPVTQEKDDTPKTGVNNNLEIVLLIIGLSTLSIITLLRKDF